MNAVTKAGYLAHGRSAVFQRRLARARQTIAEGLSLCHHPFVGFSAGKDSEAMLWLICEIQPDVTALMLTGGETRILYPSIDDILQWWRARWPRLNVREINVDHVFAEGWEHTDWVSQYETFIGEWERYLWASGDYDGVFLGLREDESNCRRRVLRHVRLPGSRYAIYRYADSHHGVAAGHYRICPLDAWTTQDVAALIALHEMPLLETYEFAGMEARTHLRTGRTSLRMGQLVELRRRDPAAWNRMISRFPELR